MNTADIKKEIKEIKKQIVSLTQVCSSAIADGKEKWMFDGEWYNYQRSNIVLGCLRNECNNLKKLL